MPKSCKYQTLVELLQSDIASGKYGIGDRIPSENQLTQMYSVSRQTVRQALSILEKNNYIERHHGSGSLVKSIDGISPARHDIAVITNYIGSYIFPDVLKGIEETLRSNNYFPFFMATYNRIDNERDILLELSSRSIDGVIAEGTKTALPNPNVALYRQLNERGIPTVFLHSCYPDLDTSVCVMADDYAGAFEAVKFLQKKGHYRIAGIFKSDDMQGHNRYRGYIDALQKNGSSICDDHILWYTTESAKSLKCEQILEVIKDCTALVCYNDKIAVQIMELLRNTPVRIPDDLAVIGFDNSTYGDLPAVKVTSMATDFRKFGQISAEKLLGLLNGKPQKSSTLPWNLVEKEST